MSMPAFDASLLVHQVLDCAADVEPSSYTRHQRSFRSSGIPTYWATSASPTCEKLVMATSPSGNSATIFNRPPTASM